MKAPKGQVYYYGTGRRKKSTAGVRIIEGSGRIVINGQELDDYFPLDTLKLLVRQPLVVTETLGKFDVFCKVTGGGLSGQAGAIRHGLARALDNFDAENFHGPLKRAGYLTRDPRMKERKKYGLKKARKASQYSKR